MTPYGTFAPKAQGGAAASTAGYAGWQSAVMASGWLFAILLGKMAWLHR